MKKVLFTLVAVVCATVAQAQDLGFSVEAGLNLSKYTGDEGDYCSMKPGFNIGVMVDVPFTDFLYLKSGLKYTQRGAKDEDGDYKYKETLGCLQIPIMASYRLALSDDIELQANVGPYIAVALHGHWKEEYGDYEEDDKIEFDDWGYKRFDFGFVLPSVGVTISNFYVGVSNELGLLNMYDDSDWKVHNYCFSINVGYTL